MVQGVAEAMPFEDNSVDVVVGTMVLCSVQSVRKACEEVKRVLKPVDGISSRNIQKRPTTGGC